jgi:hypothetical protein
MFRTKEKFLSLLRFELQTSPQPSYYKNEAIPAAINANKPHFTKKSKNDKAVEAATDLLLTTQQSP